MPHRDPSRSLSRARAPRGRSATDSKRTGTTCDAASPPLPVRFARSRTSWTLRDGQQTHRDGPRCRIATPLGPFRALAHLVDAPRRAADAPGGPAMPHRDPSRSLSRARAPRGRTATACDAASPPFSVRIAAPPGPHRVSVRRRSARGAGRRRYRPGRRNRRGERIQPRRRRTPTRRSLKSGERFIASQSSRLFVE